MTNRLPAGQPAMQGGAGYTGQSNFDMPGTPGANGGSNPMPAPLPVQPARQHRGRHQGHHSHQAQYHQQHYYQQQHSPYPAQNMYNSYMPQYPNAPYAYAPPYNMPPQYNQNSAMYQPPYMQHYQPPLFAPQNVPQQQFQPSPAMQLYNMNPSQSINGAMHSPYTQPPIPNMPNTSSVVPTLPATPASNHSSQVPPLSVASPAQPTVEVSAEHQLHSEPPANGDALVEADAPPETAPPRSEISTTTTNEPASAEYPLPEPNPKSIWGALPWSTHEDEPWPRRRKLKKRRALPLEAESVTLETAQAEPAVTANGQNSSGINAPDDSSHTEETTSTLNVATDTLTTSTPEPKKQHPMPFVQKSSPTTTSAQSSKTAPRTTIPAMPVVPALPKNSVTDSSRLEINTSETSTPQSGNAEGQAEVPEQQKEVAFAPRSSYKNWADILKPAATSKAPVSKTGANGNAANDSTEVASEQPSTLGVAKSGTISLAEVLKAYRVGGADRNGEKIVFIEPRGLHNSGVDCFMNSILQVLLFCTPFYSFLSQVKTRSALSFRNDTPLLEAMISFYDQFRVITSATTSKELKMSLKEEEYQQYGEPLGARQFYSVVRELRAFEKFAPGVQQDAPEFLAILLDRLHDECSHVIMAANESIPNSSSSNSAEVYPNAVANGDDDDWTTVDHGKRAAVTRSSGTPDIPTPVTKIFYGQTRSELKIPGRKDSNTDQPFHPLQLFIDHPSIKTIVDAMKRFTAPETIRDKQYETPRGPQYATQQSFIHSLPPILIIQLMQFEHVVGQRARKLGKKVGYPLELEIPQSVLSRQKRNEYAAGWAGLPRYKLFAVVYHHGSNMDSGHYSVDVQRQDDPDWIRINDTKITRITSQEVAEMGGEEEPAKSSGGSRDVSSEKPNSNRFASMGDNGLEDDGGDWKQVGSTAGGKKYSSIVNGKSSGSTTPKGGPIKRGDEDNKVAYLLFYQHQI